MPFPSLFRTRRRRPPRPPRTDLSVTPAAPADFPIVAAANWLLLCATGRSRAFRLPDVFFNTKAEFDGPENAYHVARDGDGRYVGQIKLSPQPHDYRAVPTLFVQHIYVVPGERGRGVYPVLHAFAREYGRERGIDLMTLHVVVGNDAGRRAYEKQGMRPLATLMVEVIPPAEAPTSGPADLLFDGSPGR